MEFCIPTNCAAGLIVVDSVVFDEHLGLSLAVRNAMNASRSSNSLRNRLLDDSLYAFCRRLKLQRNREGLVRKAMVANRSREIRPSGMKPEAHGNVDLRRN